MGDQDHRDLEVSPEIDAECERMDRVAQQASFLRARCKDWGLPDGVADAVTIDWAALQWDTE